MGPDRLRTGVFPVSDENNGVKVYQLSPADIEKMLTVKYGGKLTAVNQTRLAKHKERRARSADYSKGRQGDAL